MQSCAFDARTPSDLISKHVASRLLKPKVNISTNHTALPK